MKLLRDPVFHFVLLGALLFSLYAVTAGFFSNDGIRRIEITAEEMGM